MRTEVQKLTVDNVVVIQVSLFDESNNLFSSKVVDVTETLTKQDIDAAIAEMTSAYEARDIQAETAEKQKKQELEAVADSIVGDFVAKDGGVNK